MADAAHADDQVDIIGHIIDHDYLEVPFYNASQIFDGKIHLPSFELFGIDLSITRHIVMMWIVGGLLIGLFTAAFRRPKLVPSGFANFFEAIVLFLRDEVIISVMGESGKAYLPYLLTLFFFILFCSLLGLIPYTGTATGNISVTAGLALLTFLITHVSGVINNGLFGYLKSLVPSGLPIWLLPIIIPIELVSILAKPFALCIRLFANMIAGHVAILVFLGLIIMMKAWYVAFVSVPLAAALYLLEIFIAVVQAFIFTLLSALFINMAAHPEH